MINTYDIRKMNRGNRDTIAQNNGGTIHTALSCIFQQSLDNNKQHTNTLLSIKTPRRAEKSSLICYND